MGNLPNTKVPDHSATKSTVNITKHNHPSTTRPNTAAGNQPSGGAK